MKLITVSEFEKQRISDFFHIDKTKISAIYNGVSSHFKPVTDHAVLERLKTKYKLPDKFVFFFGNTDPKKNTIGVLHALALFNKTSAEKIHLVMLDFDRVALSKLINEVGDTDLHNFITLTGYIPNSELPGIYCLSSIFLYPSLRESFGIPMLEAMSCGVPVITSNTSSMPEVGGDAALFIDPYKPSEITAAMKLLLTDQTLRSDLVKKGFANASKYSWEAMARSVLSVYSEILNPNQ